MLSGKNYFHLKQYFSTGCTLSVDVSNITGISYIYLENINNF